MTLRHHLDKIILSSSVGLKYKLLHHHLYNEEREKLNQNQKEKEQKYKIRRSYTQWWRLRFMVRFRQRESSMFSVEGALLSSSHYSPLNLKKNRENNKKKATKTSKIRWNFETLRGIDCSVQRGIDIQIPRERDLWSGLLSLKFMESS